MEQTSNLKLPLINVNNAEDLKKTFIDYVKMISGVDDSSALQILDRVIKDLQTTKQDKLTAGENITIVDNVISGQGGVKEEDVMDIIENNAEQTSTLAIGTSATFDATSDEQIPTSKAVSDLMASAGGGSKLYRHEIKLEYSNAYTGGYNLYITYISKDATQITNNNILSYFNKLKIQATGFYKTLVDSVLTELSIIHRISFDEYGFSIYGTNLSISKDTNYNITNVDTNFSKYISNAPKIITDNVYEL